MIRLFMSLFLLLFIPAGGKADTCFTDDFNRATLGTTNWTVSNSCGGCYTPAIVGNRLRLTPTAANVATMATLNLVFPGAGNMITVEFDHFADGGSGADGIAVALSDSAVAPVPGAYGGSLGYAQRTGPNVNGFSGGWLGVGIDEFGNFSNPTEGRSGGPGFRVDSITVRGSGTGVVGYIYHRNSGTLTPVYPEVDNNGAAAPPHRYRIIIDHSNGINAWVSVARNTGAGYIMHIPTYDAKAQPGQAAVPTGWWLSFTGSTGGSDNTHEIDNLSICAHNIATPGGALRIIRWREVVQ